MEAGFCEHIAEGCSTHGRFKYDFIFHQIFFIVDKQRDEFLSDQCKVSYRIILSIKRFLC